MNRQEVTLLGRGNPGAIKGTDLWVLYSDLCNKDMNTVIKLVNSCPGHILVNACSRQDYSGRKLVAKIY